MRRHQPGRTERLPKSTALLAAQEVGERTPRMHSWLCGSSSSDFQGAATGVHALCQVILIPNLVSALPAVHRPAQDPRVVPLPPWLPGERVGQEAAQADSIPQPAPQTWQHSSFNCGCVHSDCSVPGHIREGVGARGCPLLCEAAGCSPAVIGPKAHGL